MSGLSNVQDHFFHEGFKYSYSMKDETYDLKTDISVIPAVLLTCSSIILNKYVSDTFSFRNA